MKVAFLMFFPISIWRFCKQFARARGKASTRVSGVTSLTSTLRSVLIKAATGLDLGLDPDLIIYTTYERNLHRQQVDKSFLRRQTLSLSIRVSNKCLNFITGPRKCQKVTFPHDLTRNKLLYYFSDPNALKYSAQS